MNQKIILVTPNIEQISYIIENHKQDCIVATFDDEKTKPIPQDWRVYFFKKKEYCACSDIIRNPDFIKLYHRLKPIGIYLYKNNVITQQIADENNLTLLSPLASVVRQIDYKAYQSNFFHQLKESFPQHIIITLNQTSYSEIIKKLGSENLIGQFNISHAGLGTFKLNQALWSEWQQQFPKRQVRVSQFVKGLTYTINFVILSHQVFIGQPSLQLTGIEGLTDRPYSSVGMAWINIPDKLSQQIKSLSIKVAEIMRRQGFTGPAGIDFIHQPETDRLFVIEVNARRPASMNLECWLQKFNHQTSILDPLVNFWLDQKNHPAEDSHSLKGGQFIIRTNDKWFGQVKQSPSCGIYDIKDGKLACLDKNISITNPSQFFISTINRGENAPSGNELIRIQTGTNFMTSDLGLSNKAQKMVQLLKETIGFC